MSEHKQFIMPSDDSPYTVDKQAKEEGATLRMFDWVKARKIIEEKKLQDAACGLEEDWFWTAGTLVEDGVMLTEEQCTAYLESVWATPVIQWEDGEVLCTVECWKWGEE